MNIYQILNLLFLNTSSRNSGYDQNIPLSDYNSCVNVSNSYKVGGWCFYAYTNGSWAYNTFSQSAAQTVCGPNGNLAVGVTYRALTVFASQFRNVRCCKKI